MRNDQWFAAIRAGECPTSMLGAHFETFSATTIKSNSTFFLILTEVSPVPHLLSDFGDLTDQH
jgi:hypothetical protein